MLARHPGAGRLLACRPLAGGLLHDAYRLATTAGPYFLKHHRGADPAALERGHGALVRLHALGLPVAPPLRDGSGRTVAVVGGRCYALHPWVAGVHRSGAELGPGECRRLGELLGRLHGALSYVLGAAPDGGAGGGADGAADGAAVGAAPPGAVQSADPARTLRRIEELLAHVRRPATVFDELAAYRLRERRGLLERHAHRRPLPSGVPPCGWVHGDFHPLNVLHRGDTDPPAIAAVVDWDRLGVRPRAEEAVRAAAIFFVRPGGSLDLPRAAAFARGYRVASGAAPDELAAAVHRVWWERLNDFWILRWRYQLGDARPSPQFPATSALAVWWTGAYEAVRRAFTGR